MVIFIINVIEFVGVRIVLKRNSPIGGDVEAVCPGTVPAHEMRFVLLEIEYLVNVFHIDEKRHDVGDTFFIDEVFVKISSEQIRFRIFRSVAAAGSKTVGFILGLFAAAHVVFTGDRGGEGDRPCTGFAMAVVAPGLRP